MVGMLAMIGDAKGRSDRVSGFPAGSLPDLRFVLSVVLKSLIAREFSAWEEPQKIFFPVFPRAAGNGRGGATLVSIPWRCGVGDR
jgi:hypothetical protein